MFNPLGPRYRRAIAAKDDINETYAVMDTVDIAAASTNKTSYSDAYGLSQFLLYCNETATPNAIYNWELGFHLIASIVERLTSVQQFDLAVKYAHMVFDLTLVQKGKNIWRFPPFRDDRTRQAGTVSQILKQLKPNAGVNKTRPIMERMAKPFSPHTVARRRPLAYMKRFLMKYVEALIASGDKYFRQPSMDTIPLAIHRYVEASHVMGPPSNKVPKLGQPSFLSYNQLAEKLDDFSNAQVDLQLTQPDILPLSPLSDRGSSNQPGPALPGFFKTRYFGIQANRDFSALRIKIDDRLEKIRSCLDIDGKPRKLRLWDPRLDPGALIQATSETGGIASILASFSEPLPRQRFSYLLQKALELCNELKTLSGSFLSIIERKETETLQVLRAQHDRELQSFFIDMKKKQRVEAEKTVDHLQELRKSAVTRMSFYRALTGDDKAAPEREPTPPGIWNPVLVSIESHSSPDNYRSTGFRSTSQDVKSRRSTSKLTPNRLTSM